VDSSLPIIFVQGTTSGAEAAIVAAAGFPDERWLRDYGEYYAARNIWWKRAQKYLQTGEIHHSEGLCLPGELAASEYYNDFLRPKDIIHAIGGCIWRRPDAACVLSVFRGHHEKPHDNQDVALLRTLLPHIKQALAIQERTVDLESRARWGEESLEHLTVGVIVASAEARVLFANRAARRVLDRRDGLRLENGTLRAATPALNASLRSLVASAARTGNGNGTFPGGALPVGRASSARPLDVVVSPLRSPALLGRGAAIVFVSDPDAQPRSLNGALRRLYGLTNAEARVAERLCCGESLEEISDDTATSLHTVRTHVKRALMKTGTTRQAQLVALALGLAASPDPSQPQPDR
jgi:DNA-binding CsgD family transcriptional regulator